MDENLLTQMNLAIVFMNPQYVEKLVQLKISQTVGKALGRPS